MWNADALAKLKVLVPQMRKGQRPWPAPETWTRGFECLINREVVNSAGQVIPSAAMRWGDTPRPLGLLRHEPILETGCVRGGWLRGSDLVCDFAVPPAGDALVDGVVEYVRGALALGQVVPVSMHTKNVVSAGTQVLSAELGEVSILLLDDRPGVPGARVLRYYDAATPRREPSAEAARLLAEGQRRVDELSGRAWDAALAGLGWRR